MHAAMPPRVDGQQPLRRVLTLQQTMRSVRALSPAASCAASPFARSRSRPTCLVQPSALLLLSRTQYSLASAVSAVPASRNGFDAPSCALPPVSGPPEDARLPLGVHHPALRSRREEERRRALQIAFDDCRLWLSIMLEDDIAHTRWAEGAKRWRVILAACGAHAPRILSIAPADEDRDMDWVQMTDGVEPAPTDASLHLLLPTGQTVSMDDITNTVKLINESPEGREAMGDLTSEGIQRFVSCWVKHHNKLDWDGPRHPRHRISHEELSQMALLRLALAAFFRNLGRKCQSMSASLDAQVGTLLIGSGLFATTAWILHAAITLHSLKPPSDAETSLSLGADEPSKAEPGMPPLEGLMENLVGSLELHLDSQRTKAYRRLLPESQGQTSDGHGPFATSVSSNSSHVGTFSPSSAVSAPVAAQVRSEGPFATTDPHYDWREYTAAIKILARSLSKGLIALSPFSGEQARSKSATWKPLTLPPERLFSVVNLLVGYTKGKLPVKPLPEDSRAVAEELCQFIRLQSEASLSHSGQRVSMDKHTFRLLFHYALNQAKSVPLAAELSLAYLPAMRQDEALANELRAELVRHAVTQDARVWNGNQLDSVRYNRKRDRYSKSTLSATKVSVLDLLARWDDINAFWALVFSEHRSSAAGTSKYPPSATAYVAGEEWGLFLHAFQQSLAGGNAPMAAQLLKWAMYQPFWDTDGIQDKEVTLRRLFGLVWPSLLSPSDRAIILNEQQQQAMLLSQDVPNSLRVEGDSVLDRIWASDVALDQHLLYAALRLCKVQDQYDFALLLWVAAKKHHSKAAYEARQQGASRPRVIMPHAATVYFQILSKLAHRTQVNGVAPGCKRTGRTKKGNPLPEPAEGYSLLDLTTAANNYLYLAQAWHLPTSPELTHWQEDETPCAVAVDDPDAEPPKEWVEPPRPLTRPTPQLYRAILNVYTNTIVGLTSGDPAQLAHAQAVLRLIVYHMQVFDVPITPENAPAVDVLLRAEFEI